MHSSHHPHSVAEEELPPSLPDARTELPEYLGSRSSNRFGLARSISFQDGELAIQQSPHSYHNHVDEGARSAFVPSNDASDEGRLWAAERQRPNLFVAIDAEETGPIVVEAPVSASPSSRSRGNTHRHLQQMSYGHYDYNFNFVWRPFQNAAQTFVPQRLATPLSRSRLEGHSLFGALISASTPSSQTALPAPINNAYTQIEILSGNGDEGDDDRLARGAEEGNDDDDDPYIYLFDASQGRVIYHRQDSLMVVPPSANAQSQILRRSTVLSMDSASGYFTYNTTSGFGRPEGDARNEAQPHSSRNGLHQWNVVQPMLASHYYYHFYDYDYTRHNTTGIEQIQQGLLQERLIDESESTQVHKICLPWYDNLGELSALYPELFAPCSEEGPKDIELTESRRSSTSRNRKSRRQTSYTNFGSFRAIDEAAASFLNDDDDTLMGSRRTLLHPSNDAIARPPVYGVATHLSNDACSDNPHFLFLGDEDELQNYYAAAANGGGDGEAVAFHSRFSIFAEALYRNNSPSANEFVPFQNQRNRTVAAQAASAAFQHQQQQHQQHLTAATGNLLAAHTGTQDAVIMMQSAPEESSVVSEDELLQEHIIDNIGLHSGENSNLILKVAEQPGLRDVSDGDTSESNQERGRGVASHRRCTVDELCIDIWRIVFDRYVPQSSFSSVRLACKYFDCLVRSNCAFWQRRLPFAFEVESHEESLTERCLVHRMVRGVEMGLLAAQDLCKAKCLRGCCYQAWRTNSILAWRRMNEEDVATEELELCAMVAKAITFPVSHVHLGSGTVAIGLTVTISLLIITFAVLIQTSATSSATSAGSLIFLPLWLSFALTYPLFYLFYCLSAMETIIIALVQCIGLHLFVILVYFYRVSTSSATMMSCCSPLILSLASLCVYSAVAVRTTALSLDATFDKYTGPSSIAVMGHSPRTGEATTTSLMQEEGWLSQLHRAVARLRRVQSLFNVALLGCWVLLPIAALCFVVVFALEVDGAFKPQVVHPPATRVPAMPTQSPYLFGGNDVSSSGDSNWGSGSVRYCGIPLVMFGALSAVMLSLLSRRLGLPEMVKEESLTLAVFVGYDFAAICITVVGLLILAMFDSSAVFGACLAMITAVITSSCVNVLLSKDKQPTSMSYYLFHGMQ